MPPSLRDWVPERHLVWTVLDPVGELDLPAIYAEYRHHLTIAEFRCRHEGAGRGFSGVLGPCARAGLVSVRVVAIGTMAANASSDANRDFAQIARELLPEAAAIDRREDELHGSEHGDEVPEQLRTREGRRQALREAEERLAREGEDDHETPLDDEPPVIIELDPGQFVTRPQGRRAWVREGRRALEVEREREGRPIAKDRLTGCLRRVGAWRKSSISSTRRMRPMTRGGRDVSAVDGSRRMAPGVLED